MPTESNVLCGCGRFMRVQRNSVTVEELTAAGEPYKLWDADRYACPECGAEVITGFGAAPLVEHWRPTYPQVRDRLAGNPITAPVYPGRCAPE